MRGGSDDSRTPDDEPTAVDAGWEALIGETGKGDGDSGQDGVQPVTKDHALVAGERGAPSPLDPGEDEMARLMAGEAPRLPVVDPTGPIDLRDVVESEEGASETAAPVTPELALVSVPAPAKAKVVVQLDPTPSKTRRSSGSLRVVGAPVGQAAKASRPMEPPGRPPTPPPITTPTTTPARSGGLPWLWVGVGALAVAAVAYVSIQGGPTATRSKPALTPTGPAGAGVAEAASTSAADESGGQQTEGGSGDPDAGADGETSGGPSSKPGKADPREPPPGTPPEIAAVFRRLPLGFADRAPVGGIGASGIHVDHIAMGTETQGATCRGRANDFSVSANDRAGVCVRVVHPREKEELQVLWEKHGGSTRRSKMLVLPMHAYRTRGYLVLRNEYIGDWTVHILSSDGVELARHDFTVVP